MRTIRDRVTSGEVKLSKELSINRRTDTGKLAIPSLRLKEVWKAENWEIEREVAGEGRTKNGFLHFLGNGQRRLELCIEEDVGVGSTFIDYFTPIINNIELYSYRFMNTGTTSSINENIPLPMLQSEEGFLLEMLKWRNEGFPINDYLNDNEKLRSYRVKEDVGKNFIYRSLINNCRELELRHHEFDKRLFGFNGESRTEPTPTGLAYIAEEILLRKEE